MTTHSPSSAVTRQRISGTIPLLPLYAFMIGTMAALTFYLLRSNNFEKNMRPWYKIRQPCPTDVLTFLYQI